MGSQLDTIKTIFNNFGIQYEVKERDDGGIIAVVVSNTALIFSVTGEYMHTEDGDTGAKIPKKN